MEFPVVYRLGLSAAQRLARVGTVALKPGLSGDELAETERRFGISFASDHRSFLAEVLPVGDHWPDWRHGDPDYLSRLLERPVDGVLFDVVQINYWYDGWGPRPDDEDEAVVVAGQPLNRETKLIPVYGHRYLPEGRGTFDSPVLAVERTDVTIGGNNLDDYVRREFEGYSGPIGEHRAPPPFWADLAR